MLILVRFLIEITAVLMALAFVLSMLVLPLFVGWIILCG